MPSLASTSWVFMPRQETMRDLASAGTFRENVPSAPVTVPRVVPFTMTPAPGTGELSSAEMTLPDTLRVWAMDKTVIRLSATKRSTLFIRN